MIGNDTKGGMVLEPEDRAALQETNDFVQITPSSRKPLKILFHHRTASKDGQSVHIEELIAAFRKLGHQVIMVGPRVWGSQEFGGESKLVRLLKSHLPKAIFEVLELAYSFVAYHHLSKACRYHKPDLLYERFNLYMLAGGWIRRRYGLPYFLEVNAPVFDERSKYSGIALRRLAHYTQKSAWRSADMALPVTRVLAQYLRRDGVPEERIAVIHNGINSKEFLREIDGISAKARFGLQNALVLGFTGFIHQWHGLSRVIDLLAEIGTEFNLKLLIVGDGPERASLVDQANHLGVDDRICFAGLLDRASIPAVVGAFDIALQPGATAYASPLKLFEYMALGRAIVAPGQPNIEEILVDRETALLFEPGDFESMCASVRELCTSADLRQRLGSAARRSIIQRDYTWDGNAGRIEELYHGLCGFEPGRGR